MDERIEEPAAATTEEPVADASPGEAAAPEGAPGPDASARARQWIDQLQSMIDGVAKEAAPVVRQVGLKAAELAAVAGDKAGPLAYKAAEMTESAGRSLAEKSRHLADELRGEGAEGEPDAGVPEVPEVATEDESDGA